MPESGSIVPHQGRLVGGRAAAAALPPRGDRAILAAVIAAGTKRCFKEGWETPDSRRAAAERDLTAFFATLRECLQEGGALYMRPLLPEPNRELFDYSGSCAYDASVKEFV